MEDPKIILSIVVPIYNVERYLHKCVDSLLNQDIVNYEIILVDDGSPDECPQICDSYAAAHKNIRVVHRDNGGLSTARNSGIEVAKGEYVMFIDSDDYIEPNVLGGLLAQIERDNLDVLRYNYQNVRLVNSEEGRVNSEYEVFDPYRAAKRDVDYSDSVTKGEDFLNNRLGPMCYAWAFVIRCELIHDCMFKEGIYFEDTEWTPRMLLRAKRVASTEMVVYNYFWREGSITLPDNPQKREKVLRDKISLLRGFKEQQKLVKDPKWFEWMTSFTAMTILGMLAKMPSSERKPYLKELKSLQIFPLSLKREKVLSHKVKILMANFSPVLFCKVYGG
jgi:glycosyltransferase involved in cell wall biosynthesis